MKLQLIEKRPLNADTVTFLFKPEDPLEWKPGQFLRYHIDDPSHDDRSENRFFSIASAPFENVVQLTTKFAPDNGSTFKKDLQKLDIGDEIEVFGPSGSFIAGEDPNQSYVFIAGGIGITPFRSILLNLEHQGNPVNVTLIYANRTKQALFKEELEELAKKHPEFKIYYIISDEPVTEEKLAENITIIPGKVDTDMIKKLVPDLQKPLYYISGPEPMVLALEKVIWDMGIPKEQTKRDYFPGYQQY